MADPITLTPDEIASATPITQPTAQPVQLTPEEIASAQPVNQANPVNPIRDFTPDQLVALQRQAPESFDIIQQFLSDPTAQKDPAVRRNAEQAYHQLRQEPWYHDLPTPAQMAGSVGTIVKGFGKQASNYAYAAAGAPALGIATATGAGDEQSRQELATEIQNKIATNWAGTETGLTGLISQIGKVVSATGRVLHINKQLADYTPEDKSAAFQDALTQAQQIQSAMKGQGPLMQAVGGNIVPSLNLKPEEVATAAAGDPFSWEAMGTGLGAAGKLTRAAIPEAARAAIQDVSQRAVDTLAKGVTIPAGAAISSFGKLAGMGIERAPGAAAAGAVLGATHALGLPGELSGFLAAGLKDIRSAPITRLGEAVGQAASEAPAFGRQITGAEPVTGAYAQLGRDIVKSIPTAVADIGKGAAFDLGLAATSDTPQEKQAVGLGTTLGILGGVAGAGKRALTGQLIAPREFTGNANYLPGTGTVPILEDLTRQTFPSMTPGQRVRFNATRDFLRGANPNADIFVSSGSDATAKALTDLGYSPDDAARLSSQGGVTTEINGHKVAIVNADSFDTAPHEARHAIENVMGEQALRQLDDEISSAYGTKNMDAIGRYYTSKIFQGRDPGANWQTPLLDITGEGERMAREKLIQQGVPDDQLKQQSSDWGNVLTPAEMQDAANRYVAREIAAENFSTWFSKMGGDVNAKQQVPEKLAQWTAAVMRTFGAEPLAGQVSPLGLPLSSKVIQRVGEQARELTRPSVEPAEEPATGAPRPPEKEARNAVELARTAPDVPVAGGTKSQREILGTVAEAIANRTGVKLNYLSAPEEPAAATTSNRPVRRQMIEIFRSMPESARKLWEKTFFPDKVTKSKKGYQIQGWAPEVFAANAHKLAGTIASTPEMAGLSPYEVDPATKSFTPEAWQQLYNDTSRFVANQQSGRTGSGVPLEVPPGMQEKGFFKPPLKPGAGSLDQRKADFISMLFNFKLPDTARLGGGKFPLNVAGQEVSKATIPGRIESPVIPRPEFTEGAVKKFPELQGRQILEVNPVRNEFENAALKANKPMPSFIESVQKLNLEHIKEAEHAPEASPEFRGNTLTLSAGFAPKTNEPRAVKMAAIRDEGTGRVFEGPMHASATLDWLRDKHADKIDEAGNLPPEVELDAWNSHPNVTEGFTTNNGEFLNREEAFERAQSFGQMPAAVDEPGASLESTAFEKHKKLISAFAPASREQMAEYERQRAAYEATPWWKRPPVGETETGRHTSYAGDPESGLVLHSAKQRSTVFVRPGNEANAFLSKWQQAPNQAAKDQVVESYFGPTGAQFAPDKKTFIVRHGSTEMNNSDPDKDLIRGHIDVPLDDKGRREAGEAAQNIADQGGVNHVIASDLGRTQETGQIIADKNGATMELDPGLRPWKFGPTIEGKPTAKMLPEIKRLTENPDERPPEGETFNEFKDRFLDAFHRAQENHADKNTAIVTHYRGTKLLDAWRATGTDNDTIDKAIFEKYDKDKTPGNVDVVDKAGAELAPEPEKQPAVDKAAELMRDANDDVSRQWASEAAAQFAAKKPVEGGRKSKQDWTLREGPGLFSKAWILPDGKPVQLGGQWHHEWLNENPNIAKKYGLKTTTSAEDNRSEALQKGFARVNYEKNTGTLKVEARAQDWQKIAPAIRQLAETNLRKIDNMDVHLLDSKAQRIVDSDGVALHTYDPGEKMDHLPMISEPTSTTTMSAQAPAEKAQFSPSKKEDKIRAVERYKQFWILNNGEIVPSPEGHMASARDVLPHETILEDRKTGVAGSLYDSMQNRGHLRGMLMEYPNKSIEIEGSVKVPVSRLAKESIEDISHALERPANINGKRLETGFPEEQGPGLVSNQFAPSDHPRAIRGAAVRDRETGKIYEGPMHFYALQRAEEAGATGIHDEGFMTNSGEFLNRREAFDRAKELDQLKTPETPQQAEALERAERFGALSEQVKGIQFAPPNQDELDKIKSGESFGQTFNQDGSVWQPTNKKQDIVTLASVNIPTAQLSQDEVQKASAPYSDLLNNPNVKLGAFNFEQAGKPMTSIDINAIVPQAHRENSLKFAKDNDQMAIFDMAKNDVVNTGGAGNTKLTTPAHIAKALPALLAGEPVDVDRILAAQHRIASNIPAGKKPLPVSDDLSVKSALAQTTMDKFTTEVADRIKSNPGFRDIKGTSPEKVLPQIVNRMAENIRFLFDKATDANKKLWKQWYDIANDLSHRLGGEFELPHFAVAGINARLSPQKDWYMNVTLTRKLLQTVAADPAWSESDKLFTRSVLENAETARRKKLADDGETPTQKSIDAFNDRIANVESIPEGKRVSEMTPEDAAYLIRSHNELKGDKIIVDHNFKPVKGAGKLTWQTYEALSDALKILRNPTLEEINTQLGSNHKVRSFYNNHVDPMNPQDVTVDTHAVAASHLMPYGSKNKPILENFGAVRHKNSGYNGSYFVTADAYRQVAKEVGLLPREVQSIVWEQMRNTLTPAGKRTPGLVKQTDAIWAKAEKGKITRDEARNQIYSLFEKVSGNKASKGQADWYDEYLASKEQAFAKDFEGKESLTHETAEQPF